MSKIRSTVLVTGGAGFIGSHLCECLVEDGNRVLCLDNLFTGSKDNIGQLLGNPNFVFIEQEIITPFLIEEKVNQIYNLACPASPVHYQSNAIRTIKANTIGVINVLGLAKKQGARILQASTSEIYGDPLEHPQKESYRGNVNTIGPRACYDEGKRVAETLMFDYHRKWDVEIKVARIFNTYGPRMAMDDGRVVSNLVLQALQNKPLTIYGHGRQIRSFCYIDDLVEGLVKLMNSPVGFTGPVNLGNPGEFTIKELAQEIIELTGSRSKINFNPLPEDDPKQRRPDISLAKKKLSWRPKINLEKGLVYTIEYFRKKLNQH
ncbi:MAG: SDR family oxidoreductase [Candidatus Magasanikbacteria bacterium]|nr:SDR family oxidoreductase [Candidatus Magasanikbacteria bacterium]